MSQYVQLIALILSDQIDRIKNLCIEKQQTNLRCWKVVFPTCAVGVIIIMSHKLAPRCREYWTDSLVLSFSRNSLIHLQVVSFHLENRICAVISFSVTQQPQSGVGCLTAEVSIYIYIYIYIYISHTHTHTHTHTPAVGLLWTSDQLVAEAATCTKHNQLNRRTLKPSAGFETLIPAIKRPQGCALVRTVTGVGLCNKYKTKFPLAFSGPTLCKDIKCTLFTLTLFIPLC